MKNIHFRRGQIFQDIGVVERAMDRLICLYYLKNPMNDPFISELLQDPYFSFELRKRIFKLIYQKMYPNIHFPWQSLDKMQHLRNIVAHSPIDEEISIDNEAGTKTSSKPFYSYHTQKKEVILLHEEFQAHMDAVIEALNKIKNDIKMVFNKVPIINV